ncbi:NADH-quinone oxidoreductase subunit NuoB [Acetonema longum]|uniref:NADH dehydrogenase (Quinone) n=1 Tax=Acetonema longum DSM 6540 TaxID=1009370 RepID=F7NI27_9FIRM|nr:NADH-quinone oxidoreductase subunit NuoB [Acetonema longum]EGO64259.1 NADH dehydrogenase (quinone) [Acetonema longum DSM 6540]
MLGILHKILYTGTVTETMDQAIPPARSRGEVVFRQTGCSGCRACEHACPVRALRLEGDKPVIDHNSCIFCGQCVNQCEEKALVQTGHFQMATLTGSLDPEEVSSQVACKIRAVLGRSLHIRHLDAGSCNACDFEMSALLNPVYDLQQYGIDFVASPRHADMLMVTGVVTRNLTQALLMTYEAVPHPKLVMAVGACAAGGQTFGSGYAMRGRVDGLIPVDIYVPGCPPKPQALLYGLLLALDRL